MRIIKIVSTIFLILGLVACSSRKMIDIDSEERWNLLVDNGQGVIFTAYEDDTGIPVQFKLYDKNELRLILNGEPFPGTGSSTYALEYVKSQLVIFGLNYKGETIDKIFCDCDKSEDTTRQLHFEDDDNEDGIFWTDLIEIAEAPIVEDYRFVCTGGGRTFYVEVFEEGKLRDDLFTLYFDFVDRTFRGKLVVTDVSYENQNDPYNDSVILWFE